MTSPRNWNTDSVLDLITHVGSQWKGSLIFKNLDEVLIHLLDDSLGRFVFRAQLIPDLTNGSSKTATRNNPLSPWSGLFLLYGFASQSSQVWPHLDTPCKTWSFTRLHLSPPSMYRFSMFQQQVVVTQGIWRCCLCGMLEREFSGNVFESASPARISSSKHTSL